MSARKHFYIKLGILAALITSAVILSYTGIKKMIEVKGYIDHKDNYVQKSLSLRNWTPVDHDDNILLCIVSDPDREETTLKFKEKGGAVYGEYTFNHEKMIRSTITYTEENSLIHYIDSKGSGLPDIIEKYDRQIGELLEKTTITTSFESPPGFDL